MSRFGDRLNRREYLSGASALGIGALAGCNGIGDGGDEQTTTAPETTTPGDGSETITGVVLDPTGSTVPDVRVELVHNPSNPDNPPEGITETNTTDDGTWTAFPNEDLATLREEYTDTVYVAVERDDWFGTSVMPAEEFFDPSTTHRIELDRQRLFGPRTAGGNEYNSDDEPYYGTATVWREFVDNEAGPPWELQRLRVLIRGSGRIQSGAYTVDNLDKGAISCHFPESVSTARADPFMFVDATKKEFYNFTHPGHALEPYIVHREIEDDLYEVPGEDSGEFTKVAGIMAEAIIGAVPYVGTAVTTSLAVIEILETLSDPSTTVEDRIGNRLTDDLGPDTHDSVLGGRNDTLASMVARVTLSFDEDPPDEINVWGQGNWRQPTRGAGTPIAELSHKLTMSPVPEFPGSGDDPARANFDASLSAPETVAVGETAEVTVSVTNEGDSRGTYTDTVYLSEGSGEFSETVELTLGPGESDTATVQFRPQQAGSFELSLASDDSSVRIGTPPKRVPVGGSLPLGDGVTATLTDVSFPAAVAYQSTSARVFQPPSDSQLVLFRFSVENTGSDWVDLSTDPFSLPDGSLFGSLPGGADLTEAEIRGRPLAIQSLDASESTTGWVLGQAPTATLRETFSLTVRDDPSATDPVGTFEIPASDGDRSFPQLELAGVEAPSSAGLDEPYVIELTVRNVGGRDGRARGVLEYSADDGGSWEPLITATEHVLASDVSAGDSTTITVTNASQVTGEFLYRFQPYDRTWETEILE